ncbi:hypothetical protein [Comamonas sp. B21-038]|uniref:hypothetical protein n=1 Tax=Comamonas sp. B21-038 TaxID=2918299 RepID=UPI001EFBAE13|nr:hypothetical protein [Comamonas sp. B21-038]ULR90899.1 hypothetical protein MJ205_08670 [Comamonas sp. B21-038]
MTEDERIAHLMRIEQEGQNSFLSGFPMEKRYPYDSPEYNAFEAGWRKGFRSAGHQQSSLIPRWAVESFEPYKPPAKFNSYAEAKGKPQPDD